MEGSVQQSEFMSAREVAMMVGVSRQSIYDCFDAWAAQGLRVYRFGIGRGHTRVRRSELNAFIEERLQVTGDQLR